MSTRQIAYDIWLIEQKTARKIAYVGMIRLINDWYYSVKDGRIYPFGTLQEAEEFFEA
jgi:hypothetical protein